MLNKPCVHEIDVQEYALHLMQYQDSRFDQHPRFFYYLYNLIMCHRSQATTSIFLKCNLQDPIPATVSSLLAQLGQVPDSHVGDHAMRFGYFVCGTRFFWNKKEVKYMI